MKYLKLYENYIDTPFDPNMYVDEYLSSDFHEIYEDDIKDNPELMNKVITYIQEEINNVKNIKYPIEVWRGLPIDDSSNDYPTHDEDSGCWSTIYDIATGFGNKIYHGLIESEDLIDLEQTIRTRILNPGEGEINVKDSKGVKILDVETI